MTFRKEPLVYLRGRMMPAAEAHVAIYDAAVVLGATVTDLLRTFDHKLFKLDEHISRFYRSCRYARITPPIPPEETARVCTELAEANAALLPPGGDLALVLFISPGELKTYAGAAGLGGGMQPTFCIHTFPLAFHLWHKAFTQGIHVVTPSTRHVPPQCVDPKIKNRSRMHWWLADHEAKLVDHAAVALCLDLEGNVTETGGSNFAIVRDGAVITPPPRNVLPGISLETVRDLCGELEIPYMERDFQVYDVINAEEALMPTTPYCLAPVTKINGLPIGNVRPGPVFRKLIAAWSRRVNVDIVGQIMQGHAP